MPHSIEPGSVLEFVMQSIANRRWESLHDCYALDTAVEHPFALPVPTMIRGREMVRLHFARFAEAPLELRVRNMRLHRSADPEVVTAEWDYDGVVTTTGRTFQVANIQVSRVRSGLIVHSRDYHNHAFMAAVMGRLPMLTAALAESLG